METGTSTGVVDARFLVWFMYARYIDANSILIDSIAFPQLKEYHSRKTYEIIPFSFNNTVYKDKKEIGLASNPSFAPWSRNPSEHFLPENKKN